MSKDKKQKAAPETPKETTAAAPKFWRLQFGRITKLRGQEAVPGRVVRIYDRKYAEELRSHPDLVFWQEAGGNGN